MNLINYVILSFVVYGRWAMVATRTIESRVAIKDHIAPMQLSIQELINCVKDNPEEPDRRGCYEGSINLAFRWIINDGVL